LPDYVLSLFVVFLSDRSGAFSSGADQLTSLNSARMKERTNEGDITAEHAFSCVDGECKCSVNKLELLDNAKQIVA
jgi:hypothetical protein